ncbi:MAG: hypothetical protein JO120_02990 [Solirubrobacterales bacterium]|nr:hypothetical protein [Solirubrobacterales bacterium]
MYQCGSGEEERVVGAEQWAQIRRLVLVDWRSERQVAKSDAARERRWFPLNYGRDPVRR